jgi:hypothetical protein
MDNIEVPHYFICPISLQIMKDPVTAITGITYDRESIEQWLFTGKNTACPVSKQLLPRDSGLTPNHTLRRLIQAWCTQNASHGINRIPTPKPPLDKFQVIKLIKHLSKPQLQLKTVRQLELLAAGSERNRNPMVEAGVPKAMLLFIATCFKNHQINGVEEALSLLNFIPVPSEELKQVLEENDCIIDSLAWVLCCEMENHVAVRSHAMIVLKTIIKLGSSSAILETLKPEFFKMIIGVLRSGNITQEGINAALHVLLGASAWGRNRIMMAEAGATFELIELELGLPERRTTELILGILFHLCCCADGRAQFLSHSGSIAVVSKRILTVSTTADDRAVLILSMICKFCTGTYPVLQEMLRFGAVAKLCLLLQVDCAAYLKEKVREILRSHSKEWKDSPCFGVNPREIYI